MASQIKQPEGAFFKEPRQFGKRFPNGFPQGPRTERRAKENAKLRKLLISRCELGVSPNCTGNRFLTWCHALKSRFLVTNADWQRAARGCLACHDVIEAMPHKEMARIIDAAIAGRKA